MYAPINERPSARRLVLIAVITLVIGFLIISLAMINYRKLEAPDIISPHMPNPPITPIIRSVLDPLASHIALGTGTTDDGYIIGSIENNSNADYIRIYIVINMLNRRGKVIGIVNDIAGYVSANQTYKFRVPFNNRGVSSVKIRSVGALVGPGLSMSAYDQYMKEHINLASHDSHLKKDIRIHNVGVGREIDMGYIVGDVINHSNIAYDYTYIQMDLFDFRGELIEKADVLVNDLEPNSTYKFRAPYSKMVSSIKVRRVTGSRKMLSLPR